MSDRSENPCPFGLPPNKPPSSDLFSVLVLEEADGSGGADTKIASAGAGAWGALCANLLLAGSMSWAIFGLDVEVSVGETAGAVGGAGAKNLVDK